MLEQQFITGPALFWCGCWLTSLCRPQGLVLMGLGWRMMSTVRPATTIKQQEL